MNLNVNLNVELIEFNKTIEHIEIELILIEIE